MNVTVMETELSELERKIVAALAHQDKDETQRMGIEVHGRVYKVSQAYHDFKTRSPHDPKVDELRDRIHDVAQVLITTIFGLPPETGHVAKKSKKKGKK